jgi:hypothetical protein
MRQPRPPARQLPPRAARSKACVAAAAPKPWRIVWQPPGQGFGPRVDCHPGLSAPDPPRLYGLQFALQVRHQPARLPRLVVRHHREPPIRRRLQGGIQPTLEVVELPNLARRRATIVGKPLDQDCNEVAAQLSHLSQSSVRPRDEPPPTPDVDLRDCSVAAGSHLHASGRAVRTSGVIGILRCVISIDDQCVDGGANNRSRRQILAATSSKSDHRISMSAHACVVLC